MLPSLADLFPPDVQLRGATYHATGAVEITAVDEEIAEGRVTGSQLYEVSVTRRGGGELEFYCTCPYFDDRGPCKHLWAFVIELANTTDFLPGALDRPTPPPAPPPSPPDTSLAAGARRVIQATTPQPNWKHTLDRVSHSMSVQPPRGLEATWPANRRINYIVDAAATLQSGLGLIVEVATQTIDKRGEWGPPRRMTLRTEEWLANPDDGDRHIARLLIGTQTEFSWQHASNSRRYAIPETGYDTTFRLMCETGRCRIRFGTGEPNPPTLAWDPGGAWELGLEMAPDPGIGGYRLIGIIRRGDVQRSLDDAALLLRGGLVIADGLAAPLRDGGAFELVAALRRSGPLRVRRNEVKGFLSTLFDLPHMLPLKLPPELALEEVRVPPVPRLAVQSAPFRSWGPEMLSCDLEFDYGGITVAHAQPRDTIYEAAAGRVLVRDTAAERRALDRLITLGIKQQADYYPRVQRLLLKPSKLDDVMRALIDEGWQVRVDGQRLRAAGALTAEVHSGIDWFDLDASMDFDGARASLPKLLAALERGDRTVTLDDGTLGFLAEDAVGRLRALAGLGTASGDHLRFRRSQVALLDALLFAMPDTSTDQVFEQARAQLANFDRVAPADAPEGFIGTLRPYQRDGLGWLHFLRDFGFGGCLADDMGLGKTIQVLALLEARRAEGAGTSLVVMPKSLIFNWHSEAAKFAPQLRVLDHTGVDRSREAIDTAAYDVVLTTYGTLRQDAPELRKINFDYVILDEAQAIKNATTASAKAARLLTGRHRLALSGTPLENRLSDLWSLFEFLNPGMLGAARGLKAAGAGTNGPEQEGRALLGRALRPFILRRTKQQVAEDLPERLEQTIYVELEPKQRAQYDELRDHYRASLLKRVSQDGMNKSRMHILEALLRLRQAACHPGLIDKSRVGESSSKLDVLVPRLAELAAEDHKVLVFSQFTSFLAILRARLDEEGITYAYLDGQTRDRQTVVDQFQTDPNCRAFLISLKAGGLGLNLTAAEYVFLLDPWWNPAVEAQAIDRAHRIGQTERVFAARLIARDTVEEKVLELQRNKRDLADAIITGDNAVIGGLKREDLEVLLS